MAGTRTGNYDYECCGRDGEENTSLTKKITIR